MSGIFIFNESFIDDYKQEIKENSVRMLKLIKYTRGCNTLKKGNFKCINYHPKWNKLVGGECLNKMSYEVVEPILIVLGLGFCLEGGDRVRFESRHRNVTFDQSYLYYFYQANPDLKEKFPSYNIYNTGDIPKERDNWEYRLDEHYVVTVSPHIPTSKAEVIESIIANLIFLIIIISVGRRYISTGEFI